MNFAQNTLGINLPGWLWQGASGTFAANASGSATAVILSESATSIWATVEAPILTWRGIPIVFH
jgi:hypothetical protein